MSRTHDQAALPRLWQGALRELSGVLSAETLRQWFGVIVPLGLDGDEIRLGVSDEFFANWLETHYGDLLCDALARAAGRPVQPRYEPGHGVDEPPEMPAMAAVPPPTVSGKTLPANCRSRCTFENFVVGPENRFAHAAAMGMVRKSSIGVNTNPLFIYGGNGLGKTHLLQAVVHEAVRLRADAVVEYVTCEEFVSLYVDALKKQRHAAFRQRFRRADYLLIDDVQFLAKTKQLQEEFFNTFNSLHNTDKKILLTSDKRPSEIDGLEARLVGRFDSGLTVEIIPLGMETRLAILRKKQEEHLMKFDDEVLYFIADNISSDVRRLEGALTRLITYCSLSGAAATVATTREILSSYLEQEMTARITMEAIQKRVADHFDLRVADLTGSRRPKNIAVPRMIAMYLCRRLTSHSTTEIGSAFGGRNHATVIHACNRIGAERGVAEHVDRSLGLLERQLQQR